MQRGVVCGKVRPMKNGVMVRVPATSANLGPGFDALGVALDCHARVLVERGAGTETNPMAAEAASLFFSRAAVAPFPYRWQITGDIPPSRGLGSSVAVRLGILHGLNELAGQALDAETLYRLCAELEGHPDNAAPAAFGGFAAARPDGIYFRCEVDPRLRFVLLVPEQGIETDAARTRLPDRISLSGAARNIANASLITAAFASRNYELLRGSLVDCLHEPTRALDNPHLRPAVDAGTAAGALGGYLSGSGSAVACITLENPERVATAMQSVVPSAQIMILPADNTGTVIEG